MARSVQFGGVLLPSHTLVFRDLTRVFLTLLVALGTAAFSFAHLVVLGR